MTLSLETLIQCTVHEKLMVSESVFTREQTIYLQMDISPDPSLPVRVSSTLWLLATFHRDSRDAHSWTFGVTWKLLLITKYSLDVLHYQCSKTWDIVQVALSLFQPVFCLVLVYNLFGLFLLGFVYNFLCNFLSFYIFTTKLIFVSFTSDF